ncbi:MAG TPA: hypothetical protein VFS15_19085, partial [Kofleriaceae bacterium]|nr:hypothetical protein [Kofleriaceae bacterium]
MALLRSKSRTGQCGRARERSVLAELSGMGSKTAWDIFLVVAIAVVVVLFLEPLLLAFAAVLFGIL